MACRSVHFDTLYVLWFLKDSWHTEPIGTVEISLPFIDVLNAAHSDMLGQHESPGKQRQFLRIVDTHSHGPLMRMIKIIRRGLNLCETWRWEISILKSAEQKEKKQSRKRQVIDHRRGRPFVQPCDEMLILTNDLQHEFANQLENVTMCVRGS
jgi:hypothetical protein